MDITLEDQQAMLDLARNTVIRAVEGRMIGRVSVADYSKFLQSLGCCFVTLTKRGNLRGCIGALTATMPLIEDVQEHAYAAAMEDYRFSPVRPAELDEIEIEISVLSPTTPLNYDVPEELCKLLRPGIDGVVLKDGPRRATFLPQVWEQLPDCEKFLSQLCMKMGAVPGAWKNKKLDIETYTVFEFKEG